MACAYGAKWWCELVDAIPRSFLGCRDDILRLFPATNQQKPGVIHWGAKRGDSGWCGRHVAWLPPVKRRGRNRMRLNSFMRIRVRMLLQGAILSIALRSELVKP